MCLVIEKAGIMTTVQGLGSYGLQRYGINPRWAMDRSAARLINLLLGNPEDDGTLETHFPAVEVRFERSCLFAIGGADFSAELDGQPVENWRIYEARPSSTVRFNKKFAGTRCYLAVAGGLSHASTSESQFETVRLDKGTHLTRSHSPETTVPTGTRLSPEILPDYNADTSIRIIPSAEFSDLTAESLEAIQAAEFEISGNSDRMGFRLKGPDLLLSRRIELVSASVNFGTIQLLPDGQLIVLMADHQTTGGYPRIANVASVDLPKLAQLGPGDMVRFETISVADAESLLRTQERHIHLLKTGLSFGRFW